ncbi:MAG: YceI family protein [Gaiellales bacterium]
MAIQTGSYRLGPATGTLAVRTGRTGAAAKAGHNLLLHVTSWSASIVVAQDPAETTLELEADGASLRVIEGKGGMQALGDDDRASIVQSIDEDVLAGQSISFRSTSARVVDDGRGLHVDGDLTIRGTSHPVSFALEVDDAGTLVGGAVLKQSDWGIKPYSTLFGALKVVDEVEVSIESALGSSQSV